MAMSDLRSFEAAIEDLFLVALSGRPLKENGIRVVNRGISRSGDGPTYRSEICLDLFRGSDLIDVVECFLVEKGAPVASQSEFEAWISGVIADVLSRP
jgi:hypothetical protein